MKKATKKIIEMFPYLREHIGDNPCENQQTLNNIDKTFLQLISFFENPEKEHCDLNMFYANLEGDWLQFAIEMISLYFRKDTYLIPELTESIIISDDYVDQSSASRLLAKKGVKNFTQSKIATYIGRNKFPKEDLVVAGKKFWKTSTIDKYAINLLGDSSH
jgi:hypothetical protein